ncbi:uncharacterized protein PITG_13155 [Phytophthora infestans T30-4]|uniref:Uncharacterized protein n=1 Tax=Phytophthora infestans (strain T30-4) TaxID=403677 RepID=D0NJQ4_PHYIT|nr:uncharacterized protein PITG_13155 [Phytophthora infestans T30-4]EEY59990.1 conserved hypothetical protein [Phytophthora infestans T30-4]|eukprot:XP_002900675.1 conserved hypothetical protein [Phytophthora infestans T30-4]
MQAEIDKQLKQHVVPGYGGISQEMLISAPAQGLPPWRPITVQAAFANRLFLVIKQFVDGGIPLSLLQHGFWSDMSLLLLVSKDCLKCYGCIPAWRTSFGWIATGERELGIGQGSVLAILHIGVYMDCLQEQLEKCVDPVVIRHSQKDHGINIASTMFVDDQLDASYNGLVNRARVTNMFTGKYATGALPSGALK